MHLELESRVLYNTDKLVKELWDFYLSEDDYIFPQSITNNIFWKKCVDDWSLKIKEEYTDGKKFRIAGEIFYSISQ